MEVIRIKRGEVKARREERLSREIKVACYTETTRKEKKERFFIHLNRGILL